MDPKLANRNAFAAVVVALALSIATTLVAQPPTKPAFEVASVKANKSGDPGGSLRRQPGGRVDAVNMPLRMLILFAYQLQQFRLVGGPGWLATDRFDIVAKLDGDPPPVIPGAGPDALALAMQTLLSERFKLTVHHETRELDIYALVIAQPGAGPRPALKRSTEDCSPTTLCGMQITSGQIRFGNVPLSQFANLLGGLVGRPVVDRTGLDGSWDAALAFTPAPPPGLQPPGATPPSADSDAPSIFTAVQEQLGLKLESTKGRVDVVVIDSVEHPTAD